MLKRNILLITLLAAVILFSILGYFSFKQDDETATPFDAMPQNSTAVLTVNNYSRTFNNIVMNNLMWQELMLNSEMNELAQKLVLLDSLIRNNAWSVDMAEDLKWHISFHASGNTFDECFILPFEGQQATSFEEWTMAYSGALTAYGVFEDVEIKQCEFADNYFDTFYFAFEKGLLIFSVRPDLVEDAVRTLHNGKSLYAIKEFKDVARTSGSFADWNIFVNYQDMNSLKFMGLNPMELAKSDVLWSDWTALDATVHPDLFLLNGFSHASAESYLSLFSKQNSQDIDAVDIIPDDVTLFFHFGLSNYKAYSKAKREYFKGIGKEKAYNEKVSRIKETYQLDLEDEFDQWVSNEFGIMFLNSPDVKTEDAKVAFFRLSDIRKTTATLERLSDNSSDGFPQLPMENFLDDFESVLFNGLDKPYFVIIDKYLLMSSHKALLKQVKEQYLQANTLRKSELYSSFSSNLSDQSNVYIYIHIEKGKEVYERLLTDHFLNFINTNPTFQSKFEQLGIQFKDGKKDMFYQHMAINFNPKERSQGNILWEAVLDTDILSKPQIVYNHYNNAREVFVQDVANTIYLLDNKGNILWKRQMKERILSKVHQIDIFKNNKLQMLFNGESSIYLIDRKGRDVENFPIQLPAVATNELKIIDYEKNREYRFLIGVRGGSILNYDRFGKQIKGWSFKSKDEIMYPIDYFLLNGKDYIVSAGAQGKPYVLNRRGEERLKLNENLPAYNGRGFNLELSNDLGQCKVITTDESGNFIKLKFDGQKEVVNLDLISKEHLFLYDDLNNDRKNDYILLDSNKLMVFNHNRDKLFEIELEGNDPAYLSMYRYDGGYGKIGFTDVSSKQIYLYRDAGSLDSNFPLKGNSPFSIIDLNKDGRQNVIVGLDKKIIVYNLK